MTRNYFSACVGVSRHAADELRAEVALYVLQGMEVLIHCGAGCHKVAFVRGPRSGTTGTMIWRRVPSNVVLRDSQQCSRCRKSYIPLAYVGDHPQSGQYNCRYIDGVL